MNVGDIRFYRDRWKAVEEIERHELRAMTLDEHWRKLNAIVRFALNGHEAMTMMAKWKSVYAGKTKGAA
jgi:hypothetical protein